MLQRYLHIFLMVTIVLIQSCQERIWDNPFDPDCPKEIFTPISFTAIQDGYSIKLTWAQTNLLISGFEVYRSYDDIMPVKVATPGKDASTWIDTVPIPGKLMQYRIVALAGTNRSNEVAVSYIGPAVPSKVITYEIPAVFLNQAIVSGIVEDDGGSIVSSKGICWHTSPNPTINNSITNAGSGLGVFTSTLTSLSPNTKYYVRAYATSSAGTSYGNEINFTTFYGELLDNRDGKTYLTVKIGEQIWMAENLSYLPQVRPANQGSESIPYYYVYDYQGTNITLAKATENFKTYGVLYNQPAALISCPTGWHLPSDDEWKKMESDLGMTLDQLDITYNWRGTNQGKNLKAAVGWPAGGNGTNFSNFSGLPGGFRNSGSGIFDKNPDGLGLFWSQTAQNLQTAIGRALRGNSEKIYRGIDLMSHGFSVRCVLGSNTPPSVSTNPVKEITYESALLGGNVSDDGFASIAERGIVYGTTPNPTVTNNKVVIDGTLGDFNIKVTGLKNNITYYARAYATNRMGTSYGDQVSFILYMNTPAANVSDIDGNLYKTVKIGNQTWMAENLKVKRFRDGTPIPNVVNQPDWASLTTPAYCSWVNSTINFNTYGGLYNFHAAKSPNGVCPSGWHLPTDAEWMELANYLGGLAAAGGAMKSTDEQFWSKPNVGATNLSGFNAIGGSWRGEDGWFYYYPSYTSAWWSATPFNQNFPWFYTISFDFFNLNRGKGPYFENRAGVSVRCVKD